MPTEYPLNTDNPFGADRALYAPLGYWGHPGIDFLCPVMSPIHACAGGEVIWAGAAGTAGNMVSLRHPWGVTRYLHLYRVSVVAGQAVAEGEFIGWSGNTGYTRGPHLHLDLYPDGEPKDNGYGGRVDPMSYLVPQPTRAGR